MTEQEQDGLEAPESRDGLPVAGERQSPLAQSPDAEPEGDAEPGAERDWLPPEGQSPDDME
ncbi:hypothetical protein [Planomonospora venezuelensis]|uniref:Uncharacterized protein n=1 Tax=Planomonospora venezuelensis TaxID=1999 RepID=A0A841CXV4_PLAVE|nr:hypothetical protein [Planomonospora venezuelensis]MBB5963222.1 hypothetical protein [Planomonospora venezuelensis]GIN01362.1 hypothetical protein Pve01_30200 [Planomonospora venezuelensis]